MKTTEQKIEETEKILKELKEKIKKENDKSEWIDVPELGIRIQTKIHHKDKTYAECEKDLGKGESIPTYQQIQFLRNSKKYRDKLNLIDTYEFVQNPDEIGKENNYVARFGAFSGYAYLDCDRDSDYSDSDLGVRFCKKISKGK